MVAAYLAATWGAGNQSALSLATQKVGNGDGAEAWIWLGEDQGGRGRSSLVQVQGVETDENKIRARRG